MDSFLKLINRPLFFRLYLLKKLPAAFMAGIKIVKFDGEVCITSIPFKWMTQNPFRSTYFASLSMAAEMSTGLLVLNEVYGKQPGFSMLVIKMESHFYKKATGITYFTCEDGAIVKKIVQDVAASEEAATMELKSTGKNKEGEMVAEFLVTWSLKCKSK